MDIINKLNINEEINNIRNNQHTYLFFTKPNRLDDLPNIDYFNEDEKHIKKETPDTIFNYFNNFINKKTRVNDINGQVVSHIATIFRCDFCNKSRRLLIDKKRYKTYYWCYHCFSNICISCYDNMNREIFIRRKKFDKYNGTRNKQQIDTETCKIHNMFVQRNLTYGLEEESGITGHRCDICFDTDLGSLTDYYTREDKLVIREKYDEDCNVKYTDFVNVNTVELIEGETIIDDTFDICIDCYNLNRANCRQQVIDDNMQFVKHIGTHKDYPFYESKFNSMLYWFPVVCDNKDNRILINLNPDDENYNKVCIQSINVNPPYTEFYYNYFVLMDLKYSLQIILQMLQDILTHNTLDELSIIQLLMKTLNIEFDYNIEYANRLLSGQNITENDVEGVYEKNNNCDTTFEDDISNDDTPNYNTETDDDDNKL